MMRIREIRQELGLSQAGFAKMLGIHQTAVSQWETGRTTPETEMLFRVARITGRPVDELVDWGAREGGAALSEPANQYKSSEARMADAGMRGARIEEGDTVFYRSGDEPISDGAIVAVEIGENIVIRYLYRVGNETLLVSASPDYPPIVLPENARVLGRAYAFRSAL